MQDEKIIVATDNPSLLRTTLPTIARIAALDEQKITRGRAAHEK